MRLTLQEMIAETINEARARTKLAQAQGEDAGPPMETEEEKKKREEAAKKENMEKTESCKVASVFVEKVASAVEFIVNHINDVSWDKVAETAAEAAALPTNAYDTPGGTAPQSQNAGQAKNQPPNVPPMESKGTPTCCPETAVSTNYEETPGGAGEQQQVLAEKVSSIRHLWRMRKLAEDNASTSFSAGTEPSVSPLVGASEENVPPRPSQVASLSDRLLGDNNKAINFSKGDAKEQLKGQLAGMLGEPAQAKATDPVLQNNLQNTGEAGVKISSLTKAAQRAYLKKLAEAGCSENCSPAEKEKAQLLIDLAKKKAMEKDSQYPDMFSSPPVNPTGSM